MTRGAEDIIVCYSSFIAGEVVLLLKLIDENFTQKDTVSYEMMSVIWEVHIYMFY